MYHIYSLTLERNVNIALLDRICPEKASAILAGKKKGIWSRMIHVGFYKNISRYSSRLLEREMIEQ